MRRFCAITRTSPPEPTTVVGMSQDFDAVAAARELDDLLGNEQPVDGYTRGLERDVEELTATVAKQAAELRAANQRADAAHAEIDAIGKRIAAAAAKDLEQRTRTLLEGFLAVLDDLDRGVGAARKVAESADVVEGLELVRRSFLARLAQFGVRHAPALGLPFDPQRHEAIALVPVHNPAQDGRVIDVMREGYVIGDATLRPAGVAVGKSR